MADPGGELEGDKLENIALNVQLGAAKGKLLDQRDELAAERREKEQLKERLAVRKRRQEYQQARHSGRVAGGAQAQLGPGVNGKLQLACIPQWLMESCRAPLTPHARHAACAAQAEALLAAQQKAAKAEAEVEALRKRARRR